MRITYRKNDSFAYWTQRWADVEADEAMENRASYPLKSRKSIFTQHLRNIGIIEQTL